MKSKGGRYDNLLHLQPAVLFFHGKLKPEASGISPHWIVAAKAVAGTLSAVRVKCPSPETPICWVVDHAEVHLDRYQYRSRQKTSWIQRLRITVEQKPSASGGRPELLAIKWMTNVERVYLKTTSNSSEFIKSPPPPWPGLHWNFAQDVEVQIVILPKDKARWLNDGPTKKTTLAIWMTFYHKLKYPVVVVHFGKIPVFIHLRS